LPLATVHLLHRVKDLMPSTYFQISPTPSKEAGIRYNPIHSYLLHAVMPAIDWLDIRYWKTPAPLCLKVLTVTLAYHPCVNSLSRRITDEYSSSFNVTCSSCHPTNSQQMGSSPSRCKLFTNRSQYKRAACTRGIFLNFEAIVNICQILD
jgi:hypothetical protein